MPFCRKCNVEYEEGKNFCKKCGTPLSQTSNLPYCMKCNLEYEEGDKFCNKCGSSLCVQEKLNHTGAETQQVPPASSRSDTKGNVQGERFQPPALRAKNKINKYLVLLYFIAAGIYFLFSIMFYYQEHREVFFWEFVFFTIILVSGFLLSKRKPSHLAINIIFFLLLISYIIYLINILCRYIF